MTDWSPERLIGDALLFSTTAFVTGAVTDALGHALQSTPGLPSLPVI